MWLSGVSHYENFPVASWLLAPKDRAPIIALYHFARYADDVADEGEATLAMRSTELGALGSSVSAMLTGDAVLHPKVQPLVTHLPRFNAAAPGLLDLLAAFEQDLHVRNYDSWDSLLDYCSRSANPVGRLVLAVCGCDADVARAESDAICTALQLTNFWQDWRKDAQIGRRYVPDEDLAHFGIDPADYMGGRCGNAAAPLFAALAARTRALFVQGYGLPARLPLRLAMEIRLTIAGGLRILDRLEAVNFDSWHRRPRLGVLDVPAILALAARPPRP